MSYDTVIGTATVHAIAKCPVKGCKSRRRITCPDMRIIERAYPRMIWTEVLIPAPLWDGYQPGLISPYVNGGSPGGDGILAGKYTFHRARLDAMTTAGLVCGEHNRYMKAVPVKGIVNVDKSCNARCMGATGPDCECSCGGDQHGASWSL